MPPTAAALLLLVPQKEQKGRRSDFVALPKKSQASGSGIENSDKSTLTKG